METLLVVPDQIKNLIWKSCIQSILPVQEYRLNWEEGQVIRAEIKGR